MDSEDPLFLLYTSGSTGKPKVILNNFYNCIFFITIELLSRFKKIVVRSQIELKGNVRIFFSKQNL